MKLLIICSLLFTSCASYVNSIHRQIDNENRAKKNQRYNRYNRAGDNRPINNPVTLNGVSANNQRNVRPGTRRNYQSRGQRRYKANDLLDNKSDGSLWSGENSENFLFVTNNLKRKGDIVIIEVMSKLKDKIQDELKRTFPDPISKKKKSKKKDDEKKEDDKKEEATKNVADNAPNDPNKVHDKISTKVVEQVNQDYILLRGRKEVMFKNRKRYFEIQAVVSQKDISSVDTVFSTKILEPRINVLRY